MTDMIWNSNSFNLAMSALQKNNLPKFLELTRNYTIPDKLYARFLYSTLKSPIFTEFINNIQMDEWKEASLIPNAKS